MHVRHCSRANRCSHAVRHAFTILFMCLLVYIAASTYIYVRTCRARNISRVLIEVLPHVPFTPLLLEGLLTQQIDLPSRNGLSLCFLSLPFPLSLFFIYIYIHTFCIIRAAITLLSSHCDAHF